jgi:hypothetical protein
MKTGDKVVCIDATPIPTHAGTILDYSFPCGYIEEGSIYCVAGLGHSRPRGQFVRLFIVGKPVIQTSGGDLGWHPGRFRLIAELRVSEVAEQHQYA